ncbi:hypothetical protein NIES4103_69730 (plasmid) [Nostoc sp. NIES-4103]|nr:hypothetical protein NIES4103_69730 [Nostoc sp. NIES-4103]
MKEKILLGIAVNLIVWGVSFLPSQAQITKTNRPNPILINAIKANINKNFQNVNWNEITYKLAEIDLNNDGIKETLIGIQQGLVCNNRHCPVYIFQRNGSNYRFISEVFTSRGELEVAILPNRSQGWINIAAPVFTYEPREIAWRVFNFDGKKYQLSSQKLNYRPQKIVLGETFGSRFNLADSAENNSSYIGLRYYNINLPKGLQYLGGSIVGEFQDNFTYAVSRIKKGNQEMLWFQTLSAPDSQGKVTAQVIDVLNLPQLGKLEELGFGGLCMLNGVPDPELIAIAKSEETEYWKQIQKAWRSNRKLGKFEEVSTRNIVCQNPGWGV